MASAGAPAPATAAATGTGTAASTSTGAVPPVTAPGIAPPPPPPPPVPSTAPAVAPPAPAPAAAAAAAAAHDGGGSTSYTVYSRQHHYLLDVEIILQGCAVLGVGQETAALAAMYFHKMLDKRGTRAGGVSEAERGACVLMACKITETGKRPQDIALVLYVLSRSKTARLPSHSTLGAFLELIFTAEHQLMLDWQFRMTRETPYVFLLNFCRKLQLTPEVTQIAVMFVNDGLFSRNLNQMAADAMAVAAIQLACRVSGTLSSSSVGAGAWWLEQGITQTQVDNAITDLLAIYTQLNSSLTLVK